jgi:hypothetical protein
MDVHAASSEFQLVFLGNISGMGMLANLHNRFVLVLIFLLLFLLLE